MFPALIGAIVLAATPVEADLLVVGGDEAGCAAAVQAARLGVERIVLVNDVEWLGGQFCTQGVGPMDEWTLVEGKRVNFPRSGAFLEIMERVRAHNRRVHGVPTPGNSWCGTDTIEPRAAAEIFDEWVAARLEIRVLRGWEPRRTLTADGRVVGVAFGKASDDADASEELVVHARLTLDSTDWGDVIRASGAAYLAGPDLRSKFGEPSAPETLEPGGAQEMNPITWCPLLRESAEPAVIERPEFYDPRSFADWRKAPVWVDWDGAGGMYNSAGWCIYTHRRIVDRRHLGLAPGSECVVLNWPAHDYPLSTLPARVVEALDRTEPGASLKNIVDMTPAQRRIVFRDAKQRALEFLYWLQTARADEPGEFSDAFRRLRLADDYGTPDSLPPKPYIREGLRLQAMYVLREQDVRAAAKEPRWARVMVPDGAFGYQFNLDFHPTRREFVDGDPAKPWRGKFQGARDWSADTDRAMFPLRGLVPEATEGLLGCSKNIGVTSLVQSSLRLHGQMMHVGVAAGTLAAYSLRNDVPPRDAVSSPRRVRELQRLIVRGAGGPGVLIWPWQDVAPDDEFFEAANLLAVSGVWRLEADSVFFEPRRVVRRGELAGLLVRLTRATRDAADRRAAATSPRFTDVGQQHAQRAEIEELIAQGDFGPQPATFRPDDPASWGDLHRWLVASRLPASPALAHARHRDSPLNRAECATFLYRILQQRELHRPDEPPLTKAGDRDADGRVDFDDPLPDDRDDDSIPDRLETP